MVGFINDQPREHLARKLIYINSALAKNRDSVVTIDDGSIRSSLESADLSELKRT
jgi:hypothetical protein